MNKRMIAVESISLGERLLLAMHRKNISVEEMIYNTTLSAKIVDKILKDDIWDIKIGRLIEAFRALDMDLGVVIKLEDTKDAC